MSRHAVYFFAIGFTVFLSLLLYWLEVTWLAPSHQPRFFQAEYVSLVRVDDAGNRAYIEAADMQELPDGRIEMHTLQLKVDEQIMFQGERGLLDRRDIRINAGDGVYVANEQTVVIHANQLDIDFVDRSVAAVNEVVVEVDDGIIRANRLRMNAVTMQLDGGVRGRW